MKQFAKCLLLISLLNPFYAGAQDCDFYPKLKSQTDIERYLNAERQNNGYDEDAISQFKRFEDLNICNYSVMNSPVFFKLNTPRFRLESPNPKILKAEWKTVLKNTDVLFINEAHHLPYHRKFLTDNLKLLKRMGYVFIALESLNAKDTLLNERKFPITGICYDDISTLAYSEPMNNMLVRECFENNLKLIPYDNSKPNRDYNSYLNINKIYNPKLGKLIVLCGYDHINAQDSTSLYFYFKQNYSSLIITSIDQANSSVLETSNALKVEATTLIEAADFIQNKSRFFVNYFLLHPKTILENEVPNWMSDGRDIYKFNNSKNKNIIRVCLKKEFKQNPSCSPVYVITPSNSGYFAIKGNLSNYVFVDFFNGQHQIISPNALDVKKL